MRIAKRYRVEATLASQQDIDDGDRPPELNYVWAQGGVAYAADGYVVAAVPCEGEGAVSARALAEARRFGRGNLQYLMPPTEQPECKAPPLAALVSRELAGLRGRATVAINLDLLDAAATALGTRHLMLTIAGTVSDPVLVEPWEFGVEPTAKPTPPFALVMPMLAEAAWYRARRKCRRAAEAQP